jgi:type VI secretion system protein ImpJ
MYLGPHHFQAQSRYFEDSVRFALDSLYFAPWGLGGCELDAEALLNGTLALVHARGTFPDGLVFQMPDADALPPARNITELFSLIRESMTAYLAIAPRIPDGLNCDLTGGGDGSAARFVAETVTLHDDNTGRDEKPVRIGRKNIRLLLDSELTDNMVSLPVARIRRDGSGHFVFDTDFIPPLLEFGASERLMLMLRRLVEIMEDKSANLTHAKQGGKSSAGWSSQEVANFWFLHCVNSSLAPLRHLLFGKRGHPEELFNELSRLAGALCTFGMDSHPPRCRSTSTKISSNASRPSTNTYAATSRC